MITLAMVLSLSLPPQKYDHYPVIPFTVHQVNDRFLSAICGRSKLVFVLACTRGNSIWLRNNLTYLAKQYVLRHEYGHINGWSHD